MKIHQFDIEKGIYKFELNEIETDFHSHPTFEVILSSAGEFKLETEKYNYGNVNFAIIEPNLPHRIKNNKGDILVLMVECNLDYLLDMLSNHGIQLTEGVFAERQKVNRENLISKIEVELRASKVSITKDERINKSLDYMNNYSFEYKMMMNELKLRTNLSNSRLSHLFKSEVGISIKKYFVWSKLKRAFNKVLTENKNMYKASIEVGFYDQSHLSKAFKQIFGISPSDVYNSRIIQV